MKFGIELKSCSDADYLIDLIQLEGYFFGLSPIMQMNSSLLLSSTIPASLSLEDLIISKPEHSFQLIGAIAEWCPLEESDDSIIRNNAEILIQKQVEWASHIGLSSVYFTLPSRPEHIPNFARWIRSSLQVLQFSSLMIRVSLNNWETWNALRMLIDHNFKVYIALEIEGEELDDWTCSRWIGEPVKTLILPSSCFLKNKRGFPVLSQKLQHFVFQLMKMCDNFIVSFLTSLDQETEGSLYREYLEHLYNNQPKDGMIDSFASGYHDYLQAPLQPLLDNLQSATYQVFESDPVKYDQYEQAIELALVDKFGSATSKNDNICVIMVVGAGRGPLVDRCLCAARKTNTKCRIYAIEKNSNAIITLRKRKEMDWKDSVEVVHIDMRYWNAKERCDIMVSELLGSFGDNELSPECLDGAQRLLKNDGISIPSQYSAYVAPISSSALFNNAASLKNSKMMESPFVVKFRDAFVFGGDAVKLWQFNHPNKESMQPIGHPDFNTHNKRFASSTHHVAGNIMMHGFAAYFDAVLFNDVKISIVPSTHSPDMTSWFPMYFPIKVPLNLPTGSMVEIYVWRLTSTRKVWYEWACCSIINGVRTFTSIHNKDGDCYWIGL